MRPLGLLILVLILVLILISLAGCGSAGVSYLEEAPSFRAASFTNLSDAACQDSLSAQVTSVLVKEGETQDAAQMMTFGLFAGLQQQTEPGPFFAFSPGGVRYGFFLQETEFGCVLRLYERRQMLGPHRFRLANTLDYFASRTVLYCACSEGDTQQDTPSQH